MDEILAQINKRFDELDANINKRFDKLDAYIKWVIGLSLFVNGCVLALIVKVFFFGPLN